MSKMRAKMTVRSIEKQGDAQERLTLAAVAKSDGYGAGGSDEDNTFAKFTPMASLQITIQNPELVGTFTEGEAFYVDFTPVG